MVSPGVLFVFAIVEKACSDGSSSRRRGHVYVELFGKQIVVARFLMKTVKFWVAEIAVRDRSR